ncbi:FAD-dependent oxidoreductase [Nakamurella sp. YIM 132087]|uniref:FAD-dependent oxidoreductase n=1 Tax=Nakamurella alba TaxID=2665158 RepID=A0A7K1FMZ1_9ACTN|nr:FAD-binding oxidoreductase [Nakamurella alba]MTD15535.1 FAD-dependent oxidoreductase [Nakamurella alba]
MVADVLVIGAGIVGAATAAALTAAGLTVVVVDRTGPTAGTTGSGEGNILVSDKGAGAELDLALRSRVLWDGIVAELGAETIEAEFKGGLVVVREPEQLALLETFADGQRASGVQVQKVGPDGLHELEPHLADGLPGGILYPQDMQVQPMLTAAHLLRLAASRGSRTINGAEVLGPLGGPGRITGVRTTKGDIPARYVVNATGTWAGEVAAKLGAPIPVLPRRGFVLVTEPLPNLVRRKVYTADYVANVASGDAGLETSLVVEGTKSGTILIGASRERVGFDHRLSVTAVQRLAAQAVRLFPVLAGVDLIRTYHGFRPYCPDHLPVIGPDPRVEGLLHACGHEGAGIGLAPATAELITAAITGAAPAVDPSHFRADRFAEVPV